jgi:hypothetical protein
MSKSPELALEVDGIPVVPIDDDAAEVDVEIAQLTGEEMLDAGGLENDV